MLKMKKVLGLLLAAVMLAGMLAACGESASQSGQGSSADTSGGQASGSSTGEVELLDGGVTNPTGLPITNEVIELDVMVLNATSRPDMDKTEVWDYIEEKTGIRLNVTVLQDSEKVELMFASREYPDLLMNVSIKGPQMNNAVAAGDFVELEPLLEQYAPTWKAFYEQNELAYNSSLASDGKLYSLPYIDFAPWDRNLRDVMAINQTWLDELDLELPTTTDALLDCLLAFKENAGKGSIPEDVIPYAFRFDSYVSGQFDIYGAFGVYVTSGDYLVVENGVVKNQSINPAIKEPLKFLRELYSNGLIQPEVFTDDNNTYVGKVSASTPMVGMFGGYGYSVPYSGIGPLDSGNGTTPLMRSQTYSPNPAHVAIITKENPYPVATARLLELIASDVEVMMTVTRGLQGVFWDYDEDGRVYQLMWEDEASMEHTLEMGTHNSFVGLRDQNFYENYWYEANAENPNHRVWAYQNVYEGKTMPNDMVFIGGTLSDDDTNMMNIYGTDLSNCRKTAFADFITGRRDIDADWDAYVSEMESLGVNEYTQFKQMQYDLLH